MFDHPSWDGLSSYVVESPLDIEKYANGVWVVDYWFLNRIDDPGLGNIEWKILSKGMLIIVQWEVLETDFISLPKHEFFKGFE